MNHPRFDHPNLTVGVNDNKVVLMESDDTTTETAWVASDLWVTCGDGEPWDERLNAAVTGE